MDILMINNRLPMIDGDFVLVEELEEIKQQIRVAVRTFYGDWLINYIKGLDITQDLKNEVFLDHDMKKQIREVNNVTGIKNYIRTFDRETFSINIKAIITTIYGDIPINEVIRKW